MLALFLDDGQPDPARWYNVTMATEPTGLPPNTSPPTPAGWGDPIGKSTCRACGAAVVVALATTYRPGLSLNAMRRYFVYAGELPPVTRLAFTPSPEMGTPEECSRQWERPCPGPAR